MIAKLMSLLKIGSPKVDLILDTNQVKPGDKISGVFYMEGGWVKQKLKRLECDFVREYHGEKPEVIQPVKTVLMSDTIDSDDQTEIPFTYKLPKELPPTSEDVSYRLETKLVFTNDTKSIDTDEIVVLVSTS
ncbi:sporulation protein [Aquibacillus albus]|uniref:Sporulation-control protein n=1 Tax=Aquibacillus albus TaxID=1168171 RepID=A0ABS2N5B1_9BACI|nr:sporulation protein [Aquibacillus albus]MBM7573233.1 sporulation-control protein [Aquibacillus albus]